MKKSNMFLDIKVYDGIGGKDRYVDFKSIPLDSDDKIQSVFDVVNMKFDKKWRARKDDDGSGEYWF